jgi:hypothetical protein
MKNIILSIIGSLIIISANCCDICGCSTGSYFIGPYSYFHKHFLGLRYTYRSFHTRMKDDHSQFSKDFYQTIELTGGWKIGKKWQLIAFLPFNINKQTSDDGIHNTSGVGDITILGNYNVINKKTTAHGRKIKQELWLGGGFKLPTGKFNADDEERISSTNNQPGTGSLDMLLTSTYSLRINKWGFSSNATYKINEPAQGIKFGNRLEANLFSSYNVATRKVTYSPYAGFLFQNMKANQIDKALAEGTGGNSFQGAVGIEVQIRKIAFGANVQAPIAENISGGQTHSDIKGMAHVMFVL